MRGQAREPGPGSSLTLGQAGWVCWAMAAVGVSLSQATPGAGAPGPTLPVVGVPGLPSQGANIGHVDVCTAWVCVCCLGLCSVSVHR